MNKPTTVYDDAAAACQPVGQQTQCPQEMIAVRQHSDAYLSAHGLPTTKTKSTERRPTDKRRDRQTDIQTDGRGPLQPETMNR